MDDDVDTDEEIFDSALKGCSRDFTYARNEVDSKPLNQIVNNQSIIRRVTNPDDYDRTGKIKRELALKCNIHPSMAALQFNVPYRSV